MAKLLPLILALIGLGSGAGAGLMLRPPPAEEAADHAPEAAPAAEEHGEEGEPAQEYVKLNNQFIVPVVVQGEMSALVVLSLSLEVAPGLGEAAHAREPKLRDAFLQVLFAHANAGGFRGTFTENMQLASLRTALLERAQAIVGPQVSDVLITDLVRQDN